ncbi:hypothetical protein PF003_g22769 [Phytophthora fragariae]|nr:hypothetical protein PF003_g22769 [Phytophthora fragariae]
MRTPPTSWPLLNVPTDLVGADRAENTLVFYRLRLQRLLYLLKDPLEDDARHGLVPIKESA